MDPLLPNTTNSTADITHLAFLPLNDFGADSGGFSSDDPADPADPFVDVRFESEPSPETGSFVSPTMLELT